jgi:hypothetical protein
MSITPPRPNVELTATRITSDMPSPTSLQDVIHSTPDITDITEEVTYGCLKKARCRIAVHAGYRL